VLDGDGTQQFSGLLVAYEGGERIAQIAGAAMVERAFILFGSRGGCGERAGASRLALAIDTDGAVRDGAAALDAALLTQHQIIRVGDHGGQVRIGGAAEIG
jgi:hypothetical protein